MGTLTPEHRRSAGLIKVVQSMVATNDLPTSTKRSMVAYARSIRWMIEASELAMAKSLCTDLEVAVLEETGLQGWHEVIKRRCTELQKVI